MAHAFSVFADRKEAPLASEGRFVKYAGNPGMAKSASAAKNEIASKNNTIKLARLLKRPFADREHPCSER
jgi:hypothetical protein